MQWGDIMRDRWYISVRVAKGYQKVIFSCWCKQAVEIAELLKWMLMEDKKMKKIFRVLGFLSFICGLWKFRHLSPCEWFEWSEGDKDSDLQDTKRNFWFVTLCSLLHMWEVISRRVLWASQDVAWCWFHCLWWVNVFLEHEIITFLRFPSSSSGATF